MPNDTTTPADSAEPPGEQPGEPATPGLLILRDDAGRFLPGTASLSPGRPPRQREQEYLATLSANVSETDWIAIVRRAVSDATAGDSKARAFLATWLLPPRVDWSKTVLDSAGAIAFVAAVLEVVKANVKDAPTLTAVVEQLSEVVRQRDFTNQ